MSYPDKSLWLLGYIFEISFETKKLVISKDGGAAVNHSWYWLDKLPKTIAEPENHPIEKGKSSSTTSSYGFYSLLAKSGVGIPNLQYS